MISYNFVIIDPNGYANSYLNILDEKEFLEKLWGWCYVDDLWYFLEDNPEILNNSEELEDYLFDFIHNNLFHHDDEDDSNCFAFTVTDEKLQVYEYGEECTLTFILNKIKEHYD